jgi:hypothetical protein
VRSIVSLKAEECVLSTRPLVNRPSSLPYPAGFEVTKLAWQARKKVEGSHPQSPGATIQKYIKEETMKSKLTAAKLAVK